MTPHKDNLWALITGPMVWSIYFLLVYVAAAVHCAKVASLDADIALLRGGILGGGAVALALIAWSGVVAWRRWRSGTRALPPHGDDTEASRSQFLALSTLLLCGVSFVATIFVALPAVFFASCR